MCQLTERSELMIKFNIEKLINDLGGVTKVASAINKNRTAPYRWLKTGCVSTSTLCHIMAAFPNIDINIYFEVEHGHRGSARHNNLQRRKGVR